MKNKLNKKGFTLVELLAVIVVLAIIMVIAFTSVSNSINTARANSFASSVKMLTKEIKNRIVMANVDTGSITIACDVSTCPTLYDISSTDYKMTVTADGTGYILRIEGIGKFANINSDAANLGSNYATNSSNAYVATAIDGNGKVSTTTSNGSTLTATAVTTETPVTPETPTE